MDLRNRLMDRAHHYDDRYICLGEKALLLSTAKDPRCHHMNYAGRGMVFDYNHKQWHHGGLVNEPTCLEPNGHEKQYQALLAHKAEFLESPQFGKTAVELVPLEDVLYVERPRDLKGFNLHVQRQRSDLGGVATLEFRAKDDAITDVWYEALMVKIIDLRRRSAGPPPRKTICSRLMEWIGWLQFPVKWWLSVTVPDMDLPDQQHLYPISFVMSMFWLAIFAYSVVAACDGIHADFGISTNILGFTVAAAGTSFPNVVSGMVVARQGKTTMAVANALGANVQNVFLALAIPWAIQSCCINHGPFQLEVGQLAMPILWCYITLIPVVLVFLLCGSMPRWSGGFYLVLYGVYLTFVLGQEISG